MKRKKHKINKSKKLEIYQLSKEEFLGVLSPEIYVEDEDYFRDSFSIKFNNNAKITNFQSMVDLEVEYQSVAETEYGIMFLDYYGDCEFYTRIIDVLIPKGSVLEVVCAEEISAYKTLNPEEFI